MMRLFGRRRTASYCEGCGQACSAECRAAGRTERVQDRALMVRLGRL